MRALYKVMLTLIVLAALMIVPAMAADVTIPIDQDYTSHYGNNTMIVHLIAVNITDYTMGNEFTVYGKENTIWPKLLFTYKNIGSSPNYGHLEIKFIDDQGNTYSSADDSLPQYKPGQTSEVRFLEVPVQKDRKIVGFEIVEGFQTTKYPIEYPTATPVTSVPGVSSLPLPTGCCASLLLPLLGLGVFYIGRKRTIK